MVVSFGNAFVNKVNDVESVGRELDVVNGVDRGLEIVDEVGSVGSEIYGHRRTYYPQDIQHSF